MPTDYSSNSRKSKEVGQPKKPENLPEKKVEKVVVGEVIIKKRGIGHKIKDVFVAGDIRNAGRWVGQEVLLPSLKNLVWDAFSEGGRRVIYGDRGYPNRNLPMLPGGGTRYTYSTPINRDRDRGYRQPETRPPRGDARASGHRMNGVVLAYREDAENVIEMLTNIIDQYGVASVSDFNELIGAPLSYTDQKYGWIDVRDAKVFQTRDGYEISLPHAELIS